MQELLPLFSVLERGLQAVADSHGHSASRQRALGSSSDAIESLPSKHFSSQKTQVMDRRPELVAAMNALLPACFGAGAKPVQLQKLLGFQH